jgi:hypothetical protein
VWISKNGIVQAITSSDQVTEQNIQRLLNDEAARLPLKLDMDTDRPLFSGDNLYESDLVQYSILLKENRMGCQVATGLDT